MLNTKPNVIEMLIKNEDVYFSLINLLAQIARADFYLDSVLIGHLYFTKLDTNI